MTELEFHPYANLFPPIEGPAFEELVEDIRANGIREPITILNGQILDGRNRYRAGVAAGYLKPNGTLVEYHPYRVLPLVEFSVEHQGDPLAFVLSANLHRRHLDETQRAMVATRLATLRHGGARKAKTAAEPADEPAEEPAAAKAPIGGLTQAEAAKALNVSERAVQRARVVVEQGAPELVAKADAGALAVSVAADLARLPAETQREVLRSADPGALYRVIKDQRDALTAQKKVKRAEKVTALAAKQKALPAKKYGAILGDPEWDHETWSEAGKSRAAANHYPVSSTAVIKSRPVGEIAAADCVLFLWVTVPHLAQGLDVMAAWGFTYKSSCVWEKQYPGDQQGMGYWFRVNHEILLVGTRGDIPAPALGTQWPSVIKAPVGKHSEKPEKFHELIEAYFGELPKIELNARKARPGWDVWGLEAPEDEASEAALPLAHSVYDAQMGAKLSGAFRRPSGPSIAEVVKPGDIVRTSYRTGPYRVVELTGPWTYEAPGGETFEHWSLRCCHPRAKTKRGKLVATDFLNEIVAVDGRLLKLLEPNKDEVFVEPAAPAEDDIDIPAFLRRKPFAEALGDLAESWGEEAGGDEPERCTDTADMFAGEGA